MKLKLQKQSDVGHTEPKALPFAAYFILTSTVSTEALFVTICNY